MATEFVTTAVPTRASANGVKTPLMQANGLTLSAQAIFAGVNV